MGIFLRHKWILLICLVFIIVAGSVGYYWWTTTPQYSLAQIEKAYKNHDVNLALQYVNIDEIFDDAWTQLMNDQIEQFSKTDNEWEALGLMLGQNMVESMKPALKEKIRTQIIDAIKNGAEDSFLRKAIENSKISREGDIVVLEQGDSQIELNLKKEGKHWKVVAIKGLDFSQNNSTKKGQEDNDALIKATLGNSRIEAELFYASNGDSYQGLCAGAEFLSGLNKAKSASGKVYTCNVSADGKSYATAVPLASDPNILWCLDSSGYLSGMSTLLEARTSCL